MVHYDEDDFCRKCGKQLETDIINYEDYHDGGCYDSSYRKVCRDSAKKVGLGFYCNDCYNTIGNSKTSEIIDCANKFIDIDINNAIDEIKQHFDNKMKQMLELKEYIKNGIEFLKDKTTISELTEDELRYFIKRNYLYKPNHQEIKIGFCYFDSFCEVEELLNIKVK